MNREELREKMLETHFCVMRHVEKESPSISFRARILDINGKRVDFAIISSSTRVKTTKMAEEKVLAKTGRGEIEGTVVEGYENTITVQFSARMKEKCGMEISLRCNANYNNEILQKAAENFFDSEKFIHPVILECYKEKIVEMKTVSEIPSETVLYNSKLNRSQQLAVEMSLTSTPFKILGPPGTGKTETIVEIVSQYLKMKKTVLVCGPSNISVDNIISRFILSDYNTANPTSFYRLGSAFKGLVHFNIEQMANEAVRFMEAEKDEDSFSRSVYEKKQEFVKNYKKKCPLVFSTLFSSLKEGFFFDVCVVDEACQATELECLMGIVKARTFLIVGDPNQLCPVFSSFFEHLDLPTVILVEQYRMHADLLAFSNNYFYDNMIVSPKIDDFRFFEQSRILFVDTSYFGYMESASDVSKMNIGEAEVIQKIVVWLNRSGNTDIGVIAPYSGQVRLLREMIDAQVETVDGFQGQERDFIILSLVRSNDDGEIGFLSDKKRLNVAITRSKRGLVVVGDSQNFVKDKFFRQFFRFLEDRAYIVDPETLSAMMGCN